MSNTTRRTFLKGLAYSSALSLGGLSSLAIAKSSAKTSSAGAALPSCDIHLLPTQHIGTEILSLFNHTDKNVTIENITRHNLDDVNKFLAIKVNKLGKHAEQNSVTLAPGETMEFVVAAISSDNYGNTTHSSTLSIPNVLAGQLKVNSDHLDFSGIIPVTVFDSQVA